MNPAQREQFRISLLRQLGAAAPFPLPVEQLVLGARLAGFRTVEADEVSRELDYLKGKGFAALEEKPLSPEVTQWKATSEGRDQLAKLGLD